MEKSSTQFNFTPIKRHFEHLGSLGFQRWCGSYLFDGQQMEYQDFMYPKQNNLHRLAKQACNVLEIGVYLGHSALIMLDANSQLQITGVDIDPTYAKPAVEYLNSQYGERFHRLVIGDSQEVLSKWTTSKLYDLVHIDGAHAVSVVEAEIRLILPHTTETCVFVLDDIDDVGPAVLPYLERGILSTSSDEQVQCKYKHAVYRRIPQLRSNTEQQAHLIDTRSKSEGFWII